MWLFNLLFSSLSQLWYVEISRSVSVNPLEFEIMRIDCITTGGMQICSYNSLLTGLRWYFHCGTFCELFCSVSLSNVFLLKKYASWLYFELSLDNRVPTYLGKSYQLCLPSVILWLLYCICLSFLLVLRTWYGSDCMSSGVLLFTLPLLQIEGQGHGLDHKVSVLLVPNPAGGGIQLMSTSLICTKPFIITLSPFNYFIMTWIMLKETLNTKLWSSWTINSHIKVVSSFAFLWYFTWKFYHGWIQSRWQHLILHTLHTLWPGLYMTPWSLALV